MLAQRAELDKAIALAEEDEIITKAIESLTEYWASEMYSGSYVGSENGYLEIKWTRVVRFFLLSDYFGSAPYYGHAGIAEWVAFKTDGSFEVLKQDPISLYRSKTFETDFEPIIESISDRGSDFNQVFMLLE